MEQIRQGDVLLRRDDKVQGKRQRRAKGLKTILALGEVTGHHHRFETGNVMLFRHDDGGGHIVVDKPAQLIHEEHSGITVLPGIYRQGFQVEYTPAELRRVAD
jgi:hypothetical protein